MQIIRKYWLLLVGLGFSNLGNWIYLVALNLFVWHLTESPAAMAGIFVVGPTARVLTNLVAGSFIDRMIELLPLIEVGDSCEHQTNI